MHKRSYLLLIPLLLMATPAESETKEEAFQLTEQFIADWNEGSLDAVQEHFNNNSKIFIHGASLQREWSIEDLRAHWEYERGAWKEVSIKARKMILAGERMIIPYVLEGTLNAPQEGVKGSEPFLYEGLWLLGIHDGKVNRFDDYTTPINEAKGPVLDTRVNRVVPESPEVTEWIASNDSREPLHLAMQFVMAVNEGSVDGLDEILDDGVAVIHRTLGYSIQGKDQVLQSLRGEFEQENAFQISVEESMISGNVAGLKIFHYKDLNSFHSLTLFTVVDSKVETIEVYKGYGRANQ